MSDDKEVSWTQAAFAALFIMGIAFAMWFAVMVYSKDPEFRHLDKVKVVGGFYEGKSGWVESLGPMMIYGGYNYNVVVNWQTRDASHSKTATIHESDLDKLDYE